jgi:hypothetical protein
MQRTVIDQSKSVASISIKIDIRLGCFERLIAPLQPVEAKSGDNAEKKVALQFI